jgi:hypothetical protein
MAVYSSIVPSSPIPAQCHISTSRTAAGWSYREQDGALEPKFLSIVLIQQNTSAAASTETIMYLSPSITFLAVAVPGDIDGSETASYAAGRPSSITIAAALQRRKGGEIDKTGVIMV